MDVKKAKDKAVNKAKDKVAKKTGKPVKKAVACIALLLLAAGCQQLPSRSQTLTLRDCVINVYGGSDTNHVASVEIGTQAMAIENNGTETMTPTQTTDVKPDIDVSVGAAKGGGILETAASAGISKLTAPSANAVSASSAASVECTDGSCTPGGMCADGSCSE